VLLITEPRAPPKYTILFPALKLKLLPDMLTVDPTAPVKGENEFIIGLCAVLSTVSRMLTIKKGNQAKFFIFLL
jgi:hypothetical protein